jgi:hypothetical protein
MSEIPTPETMSLMLARAGISLPAAEVEELRQHWPLFAPMLDGLRKPALATSAELAVTYQARR